ncbi:MAG: Crp/Fnr family transcriptional regulator [Faecalibacterium sp.]
MLKTYPILASIPLFAGIHRQELAALLPTLSPTEQHVSRGEIILRAGQQTARIGILLDGCLQASRFSPDGTANPIPTMDAGSVFGDVLGGASVGSPVTIQASSDCTLLWLPYDALLRPQQLPAPAHGILLQNLLRIISDKYFDLAQRLDFLVLKSLRGKISAYLLSQAAAAHSNTFTIPFTRAKLAAYLNCERSALCRELSKMQQEGLLETYQKSFKLLCPEALSQLH